MVPAAGRGQGGSTRLAPRHTRWVPRDGVVPGGSLRIRSRAACAAEVWRVWTRSLRRPVFRAVRLSTRYSAGAPGLLCVDANTSTLGSEDATAGSRARVRVRALPSRLGRGGLPGTSGCASPFLWPFLLIPVFARPPQRSCRPVCVCLCFPFPPFPPPPHFLCAPSVARRLLFPALGILGPGALWLPPPHFCGFPLLSSACPRPAYSLPLFGFFPCVPLALARLVCSPSLIPCRFSIFCPPPPPLRSVVCVVLPLVSCCAVRWCALSPVLCHGVGGLRVFVVLHGALLGGRCSVRCVASCGVVRPPRWRACAVLCCGAAPRLCRFAWLWSRVVLFSLVSCGAVV